MTDWISVKDGLPKCRLTRDIFNRPSGYISDVVLVVVKSLECDGVHRYVSTDIMSGHSQDDIRWLMKCGCGGSAVYNQEITHWMPLPNLPIEGEVE